MRSLLLAIPDMDVLRALEPEELGGKILFLLKKQTGNFYPGNLVNELSNYQTPEFKALNREGQGEVSLAIREALAWLEAQGLIVPAADSGGDGWRVLSRRARRFESEAEFADYKFARLLPREMLHQRLSEAVWMAFMRAEFDVAVLQALKAVEVAVREASGLGHDLVGVKLMRAAFAPESGPLADPKAEGGERVGRMELFAGAIGSYKNPQSHRDVNLDDPPEAIEIILLANHLLRIVDARAGRKGCSKN